mmetsp:Transcript_38029/g.118122  ORF Transcript_38029/g.118122 Transcript_38029/m.118122 type:complete len:225 (-) Transcript_38029:85-759(-)
MLYTSDGMDMTRFTPQVTSSYSEEPASDKEKHWKREDVSLPSLPAGSSFSPAPAFSSTCASASASCFTFTSCSSSLCASASHCSSSLSPSCGPAGAGPAPASFSATALSWPSFWSTTETASPPELAGASRPSCSKSDGGGLMGSVVEPKGEVAVTDGALLLVAAPAAASCTCAVACAWPTSARLWLFDLETSAASGAFSSVPFSNSCTSSFFAISCETMLAKCT